LLREHVIAVAINRIRRVGTFYAAPCRQPESSRKELQMVVAAIRSRFM